MKNSNIIIDINYKDGLAVRASLRQNKDVATVKTDILQGDPKKSAQENLFMTAATVLSQLNATEFQGRVSLILPESVALRTMGANKVVKEGGDAFDKLYLPWMTDADKSGKNDYRGAISAFVEQLEAFYSDGNNSLNIVNARALYRYELLGEIQDLKAGDTIKLVNSSAHDGKIACTENNYLNGTFGIMTQTIRDRQGNSRIRVFVNRVYKVTQSGEQKSYTASELLTLLDENPNLDIQGNTEATSAAITALKLRKINAENLPRVVVAKVTKVEVANGNSLF